MPYSYCVMSPWSFRCLRYYWSFYSPSSPLFLVWFWWHSYFLAFYLSSRNSVVSINSTFSANSPRCSTRISPWSTLIHTLHYSSQFSYLWFVCRSSSICRYDTQLFISFRASEFSANILHLQNTIDLFCQWMSANLLSINLKLSFFLLAYLLNYLKSLILLF